MLQIEVLTLEAPRLWLHKMLSEFRFDFQAAARQLHDVLSQVLKHDGLATFSWRRMALHRVASGSGSMHEHRSCKRGPSPPECP